MLQAYVPNEGTAWAHAREELRRFFERVLDPPPRGRRRPTRRRAALAALAAAEPPAAVREVIGAYLDLAALLGRRTAEMHLALASNVRRRRASRPSPTRRWTGARSTSRCATWSARRCACCASSLGRLPPRHRRRGAPALVGGQEQVLKVFEPFLGPAPHRPAHPHPRRLPPRAAALHRQGLRHHRLRRAADRDAGRAAPQAQLPARRRRHDPLVPLRGVHARCSRPRWCAPRIAPVAAPWADAWYRWVSGAFLRAYLEPRPARRSCPRPTTSR